MRNGEVSYWWRALGGFPPRRPSLPGPAEADAKVAHAWCGVLGVPRDWCASVTCHPASGMSWAGVHGLYALYRLADRLESPVPDGTAADTRVRLGEALGRVGDAISGIPH